MLNPAQRPRFSSSEAAYVPIVLVVDDEPTFCLVMQDILAAFGCDVVHAHSAAQAIQSLQQVIPDLILTDVMMPEVDGLDLIRRIRAETAWSWIPIVVVSARARQEDVQACYAAGADAWLPKPFSMGDLRATVQRYLVSSLFPGPKDGRPT